MRLIDADALIQDLELSKYIVPNSLNRLLNTEINRCIEAIDNAPAVPLPDFKEGYKQAIRDGKTNFSRPQGECRTCRHRDPEDKKCDCGALERQGCPFPVSDNYFCKFYEKGGAE